MKWIVGVLLVVCPVFELKAFAQESDIYDFYPTSPCRIAPLPILKTIELTTPTLPAIRMVEREVVTYYFIKPCFGVPRLVDGSPASSILIYDSMRIYMGNLPYGGVLESL